MIIDENKVRIKVIGDYACFTRPDLKVERMTYPCMTPSAARGILDSILWKPEFCWYVHRIIVLNPLKFTTVKRNEIKSRQNRNPIEIEEDRTQRNSVILKDVAYIIEASVCLPNYDKNNTVKKYTEMFKRRVAKGQCWHRPYLGTREFAAEFMPVNDEDKAIDVTYPIGSMLYDMYYDEKGKATPLYFYDAAIIDGVLECPQELGDKMINSTHIRPNISDDFSAVVYELNKEEEDKL